MLTLDAKARQAAGARRITCERVHGREGIGVAGLAELGPDPAKKYGVFLDVRVTVGTTEYNNLQQLLYCTFITSPFSSCYPSHTLF